MQSELRSYFLKHLITTFLILGGSSCIAQVRDEATFVYGGREYDFLLHGTEKTEYSRRLYLLERGQAKLLWQDKRNIRQATLSPSGKHIAFVTIEGMPEGIAINGAHYFNLSVIDRLGTSVKIIEDGVRYSWSPAGDQLVVITGTGLEEKEGFRVSGIVVYDLSHNKILPLDFKTYDINWSSYDGLMYYIDYATGGVKSFNMKTKKHLSTNFKGIYLSPDGDYYFKPMYEGTSFALYSRDGVNLTDRLLSASNLSSADGAEWINGATLLLKNQRNGSGRDNVIYKVKENQAIVFPGLIVGTSNDKTKIGILDNSDSVRIESVLNLMQNK